MEKENRANRIPVGRKNNPAGVTVLDKKKGKGFTTQFAEVKLARERAHLERVSLALLQERRTLVKKDEIVNYVTSCNVMVVSRLQGLPDKIAPRLVGQVTSRISLLLREELHEILEELAYEGNRLTPEPDFNDGVQEQLNLVLEDMETEAAPDGE